MWLVLDAFYWQSIIVGQIMLANITKRPFLSPYLLRCTRFLQGFAIACSSLEYITRTLRWYMVFAIVHICLHASSAEQLPSWCRRPWSNSKPKHVIANHCCPLLNRKEMISPDAEWLWLVVSSVTVASCAWYASSTVRWLFASAADGKR